MRLATMLDMGLFRRWRAGEFVEAYHGCGLRQETDGLGENEGWAGCKTEALLLAVQDGKRRRRFRDGDKFRGKDGKTGNKFHMLGVAYRN
jgi:hypothetical protein